MSAFRSLSCITRTALWGLALAGPAGAAPLPGGASSLTETHQDWVVACQVQEDATGCVMRQVLSNTQTGQHVLTAEFGIGTDGGLHGALVLPFGLALANGVSLAVDEGATSNFPFSTCLPVGCIVPVRFETDAIERLRAGTTLRIGAVALAPAQPLTFEVSLKGFTAASNRVSELIR